MRTPNRSHIRQRRQITGVTLRLSLVTLLFLSPPANAGLMAADDHAAIGSGHRDLTLAVFSDVGGWISSTALDPRATSWGLAHWSGPLRDLRTRHPGTIVLALGDWVTGAPSPVDPTPALAGIAQSFGVAAALPGERDLPWLARRPETLRASPLPWVASDVDLAPGTHPFVAVPIGAMRIGVTGLTRPGLVAATRLRRAGVRVYPADTAARDVLAQLSVHARTDLTVALANGTPDSAEHQATALVEGQPVRYGVDELATGDIPVDLVIARGIRRKGGEAREVTVDTVPTVRIGPGLTVVRVSVDYISGRWHVSGISQQPLRPAPDTDPEILAQAGQAWTALAPWLAEPTRAIVSGYNRKAAFIECAGELSHGAVAAAQGWGSAGSAPITLLPHLWRFEPLRKRERGMPITRAHLYRWMPYDGAVVPAQFTARQIALLLEPYARYRSGWTVSPSLVLHPGGITAEIPGRATQPVALKRADSGTALTGAERHEVFLSTYHSDGAGGLMRKALVQPGQIGVPGDVPLRELVFRWMASPAFAVPEPCASFLLRAPEP